MKKIYMLLIVVSLTTFVTQATAKTTQHTIQSGETLFTIARKHHTTIEEVRKANGLKKGDMLKIGRVLKVPQNTYFPDKKQVKQSTKKKHKLVDHSIKNGETLFTIARKHHTTIEEVRKANGLKKGDMLKIGRILKVPQNTYFPNEKEANSKKVVKKAKNKKIRHLFAKHRIKSGETLFIIARKHHTTIEEVRKENGLKKGETLKIGKILKVPTNTYNIPKIKMAKVVTQKKNVKIAKKKISKKNKKLVASLSKLETVKLQKESLKKKKKHKSTFSISDIFFTSNASNSKKSTKITSLAKKKLGRRYVWGATGQKNTFDCSGFTTYVYKKNGINLPRRAIAQSKYGKYVPRDKLQKGDLIFFDTSKQKRGYVNHVGIYLGNGKFIHASSAKKKVVVSKLSNFYAQRYKGARRPS